MFSSPFPSQFLLLAAAVFVLAGLVKGVVGLGLPTVAMGLLALAMPPAQAAALLVAPSLITNLWQLGRWATLRPLLWRLAPMQIGVVLGTLVGGWCWGAPAGAWASVALGAALLVYAAWGLAGAQLRVAPRVEKWLGPCVGALTGLVTAVTGVFVLPAVPYLQALGLPRESLMQAMGLSFSVSTVALAAGLSSHAGFSSAEVMVSLLMLLPAALGMLLGQMLRSRLSPARFRLCFFIGLGMLGLHMMLRQVS
ncbi:sulfite exporter TauE/SafE family protein [Variovorax sp. HJSM1_2]|uniref:sulfite exporter TauE/SafE family protein n=1 Tax=Variovorax sp. HJSM1_2 TaxID=3366263 RepID=UPI003BD40A0F